MRGPALTGVLALKKRRHLGQSFKCDREVSEAEFPHDGLAYPEKNACSAVAKIQCQHRLSPRNRVYFPGTVQMHSFRFRTWPPLQILCARRTFICMSNRHDELEPFPTNIIPANDVTPPRPTLVRDEGPKLIGDLAKQLLQRYIDDHMVECGIATEGLDGLEELAKRCVGQGLAEASCLSIHEKRHEKPSLPAANVGAILSNSGGVLLRSIPLSAASGCPRCGLRDGQLSPSRHPHNLVDSYAA